MAITRAFFITLLSSAIALLLPVWAIAADPEPSVKAAQKDHAEAAKSDAEPASAASQEDVSASLQKILEQAGAQGLITLKGKDDGANIRIKEAEANGIEPSDISDELLKAFEKVNNLTSDPTQGTTLPCLNANLFDFELFKNVAEYEEVTTMRSKVKDWHKFEDTLSLARTYLALGMGEEAAALAGRYSTPAAMTITAMGRSLGDDLTSELAIHLISDQNCTPQSRLWSEAFIVPSGAPDLEKFNIEELKILKTYPAHLGRSLGLSLATRYAESGDLWSASKIFELYEPRIRQGYFPKIKDDQTLYLFALVMQNDMTSESLRILMHLSQRDGVYRAQAIRQLAQAHINTGEPLYADFTEDIHAVRQQYNGQEESHIVTLETIKFSLQRNQFKAPIDMAKQQFAVTDPERSEAVAFIAEKLIEVFDGYDRDLHVKALDSYVQDQAFFESYDRLVDLKAGAAKTAIALTLPELVADFIDVTIEKDDDLLRLSALAYVHAALKDGDYFRAEEQAGLYPDDPAFKALSLEASLRQPSKDKALEKLAQLPDAPEKFDRQADVAWRESRWDIAHTALEDLAETGSVTDTPQNANADTGSDTEIGQDLQDKLALATYIGPDAKAYINHPLPQTAKELEDFTQKLDADIRLIEAYLDNG